MSSESLCEHLLDIEEGDEKRRLMEEASATDDCLEYALDAARSRIPADSQAARRFATLATALAEARGDLRSASLAWRVHAQAHRIEGSHAEAASALETASALALRSGDPLLAAQTSIGLVDSLGWIGRYEEALALARRLERELLARNSPEDAAKVLVNMGSLHYRRDQYKSALECYERAAQALSKVGDPMAMARVQANTANVLMEMNRPEDALRLFGEARDAFAQAGLSTATAMVDANIGFLHYSSGRHGAAVAALMRARQEFLQRGQALEAAKCDADIAEAYRELNLYPEALNAYESAIRHFEGVAVDYERARAEMGRASVLMALARTGEALEDLERAESLFRAHQNSVRVAHVQLLRAYLLDAEGRIQEAGESAARAAATFSRHRLSGWAAEARFVVAAATLRAGGEATRSMQSVSRAARDHSRGWLEARAESSLGRYCVERGLPVRALRHFRKGVNALEQSRTLIAPEEMHVAFLRNKISVYEQLVGALLERGRPRDIAEALEIVERAKSRLLLERVQTALEGRTVGRFASSDLEGRLAALRADLSREYHRLNAIDEGESRRLGSAGKGDAESLALLEREYRAALQEADLATPGLTTANSPLPNVMATAALQAALQPDETLVEFYVIGQSVCAFVVTRRRVRVVRDLAKMAEVTFSARRLRFQLQRMGGGGELIERHASRYVAETRSVLGGLYDLLLRPLESALTTEKVVLVPHSGLHGLPFHAFHNGAEYALERWEFSYAPSAAIWYEGARRATDSREKRSLGATDKSSGTQGTALLISVSAPGIEKVTEEVDRLASLLPRSVSLQGGEATLEAFRTNAGSSSRIHLATHALYRSDNPLFSGLKFFDGWLLARDLYDMTLDCDLATLSACQTGLAFVEAGDELFGLQRGFLAAGARSVAASLWLADDAATSLLMEQFYTGLTAGSTKAAALRAAQRFISSRYPHPYHWAAFILIGER